MSGASITPAPDLVAPLRRDPGRAAILTDIDGTLAAIVERAGDAAVPAETSALLAKLSRRYALVGCISGRRAEAARAMVGVEGIAYSGNHGLELLLPGADALTFHQCLDGHEDDAREHLAGLDLDVLASAGVRVEDKGPIQALHWRGAADELGAEGRLREIADTVRQSGLGIHWGRKVLEIRPPGGAGKDRAVTSLLEGSGVRAAIYAGDDRTDLDAFRGLREAVESGALDTAICVGVSSEEGPPELVDECDLLVDGPTGWLAVLRALAA